MTFIAGLLIGGYVVGLTVTFVVMCGLVALGGRNEDVWKPFVYSAVWPLLWTWCVYDFFKGIRNAGRRNGRI